MILDATPMLDLALEGTVVAVAADRGHHFSKRQQGSIVLVEKHGVEGDAHAGAFVRHRYLARRRPRFPNLRQVHPRELFDTLRALGYDVYPGELGENITTAGLELERLPVGTIIRLGATAAIQWYMPPSVGYEETNSAREAPRKHWRVVTRMKP